MGPEKEAKLVFALVDELALEWVQKLVLGMVVEQGLKWGEGSARERVSVLEKELARELAQGWASEMGLETVNPLGKVLAKSLELETAFLLATALVRTSVTMSAEVSVRTSVIMLAVASVTM